MSCCRWSSYEVTCYNCCIIIQSGMFVVACMASTFNYIPGISSSLLSLWLCLESQSAMNRSGPDFYMILTLYQCILERRIHCLWDSIATSFLKIVSSGFDLLSYSSLLQSSSDGTSQAHDVYLVPLFKCCSIFFLHLTGSWLQTQWVWVWCCLVLCPLGSLYHFWFVVGQLSIWFQMHLSPGTVVGFHHKISYIHLLLLLILPCQIVSGMLHSRPIWFGLMSAVLVIHKHLQC